jgi:3-hydroxy-3-methylglutaryl CoA synthase
MAGIVSIGAYIPQYRLARTAFAEAWGAGGGPGERSVASHDEDTTTLAVNAVVDVLRAHGRSGIDALFFASTTPVYREKLSAALIATAADLGPEVRTADFGDSLRAGTAALFAALDAVNAGSARNVLVVASDTRRGYPRSSDESNFGDAAVALIVGKTGVAAEITAQVTQTNDILDVWRRTSDSFVRSWEERFAISYGYDASMKRAVNDLLAKGKLAIGDVSKVIAYGPDLRNHAALMRGLGADPKEQVQDNLISSVGNTGAAHALLMFVAALEEAKAGDRLLVASYGDGADAFLVDIKKRVKKGRAVSGNLGWKRPLTSYDRFLAFSGTLETNPEAALRVEPFAASTIVYREQAQTMRLHAGKCNQCGTVQHPIQRICYECRSKDDYTEVRLFDQPAKIFSFTRDNLAGGLEPPVINCVVESDEGQCRVFSIATDTDPMEVKVGTSVEFTFRKMHEGGNFHNYYWKVRPLNGA